MTSVPIALRSNPSRYTFSGSARLLNAYAEQQGEDAKKPYVVLPCPGMVSFSAVTDTPCRGMIYSDALDAIYTVHSSSVWKVNEAGTATYIGVIPGTDHVQMSVNMAEQPQIAIHTASGEFYVESDQVKENEALDDFDNPFTVVSQDYGDGFTVFGSEDGRAVPSAANDVTDVDPADYFTAEQSADKLTRVKFDGDLYLMGQKTVEPWRLTSAGFEPIAGATIKKGLVAPHGVVSCDNTLMWPTEDNLVVKLNGYNPVKISTHEVDRLLQADADRTMVHGLSFSFQGHSFANWTGSTWSRCYDAATQLIHERQSYGQEFWRARHSVRAWGREIVGDTLTGNLYYLDGDTFTEGGNPLIWGLDTPVIHSFPNGGVVDAVHIDINTGVGVITGQGSAPLLMLSWSVDGGLTFRGDRQLSLGARGNAVRVTTRRLGRFGPKGIILRLRVSDPVVRAIVGMDIETRPLKK